MPFDKTNVITTHRLAACHEAQIDALTMPGLADEERVRRFAKAAGFINRQLAWVLAELQSGANAAFSVWNNGAPQKSIFADLPGCQCPVTEKLPGVPHYIPRDWNPTRSDLEVFARIQQERRA